MSVIQNTANKDNINALAIDEVSTGDAVVTPMSTKPPKGNGMISNDVAQVPQDSISPRQASQQGDTDGECHSAGLAQTENGEAGNRESFRISERAWLFLALGIVIGVVFGPFALLATFIWKDHSDFKKMYLVGALLALIPFALVWAIIICVVSNAPRCRL